MADVFLTTIRFSLSVLILLFLPGFALTYWLRLVAKFDRLERIFLSILLSLFVTVFVAYVLSVSPIGLTPKRLTLIVAGTSVLSIFSFFFYLMISGRASEVVHPSSERLATPVALLSAALFIMLILGAFSYINAELVLEQVDTQQGTSLLSTD